MHIKNKRGQSTVEYVLLVTAVLAVIIAFVGSQKKGAFQDQMNQTLNSAVGQMTNMADTFSSSHSPAPASNSSTTPPYTINVANGVGS